MTTTHRCDSYFEVLSSLSEKELEDVLKFCVPDYTITEERDDRFLIRTSRLSASSADGRKESLYFALRPFDYESYFFEKNDVERLKQMRDQLERRKKECWSKIKKYRHRYLDKIMEDDQRVRLIDIEIEKKD